MNIADLINEVKTNSEASVRRNSALKLIALQPADKETVQALVNGLTDSDRGVRDVCSRALSLPPDGTSILYAELISPLICNENIEIRNMAADILIKIGEDSIPGLKFYLNHTNKDIRQFAIEIIGKIGVCDNIEVVIALSSDDCENVRNAAIEALGNLKADVSIDKLIQMYDIESELRPTIIEALGKIGGRISTNFLFQLMCSEEDVFLKIACIDALALCGDDIEICTILMGELGNTKHELQVILLKTIYAIANRIDVELELPPDLRFIAYNAINDDDIELRFAGLVALGCCYVFEDIEYLINEVIKKNEDTAQFILTNLLINSTGEVINQFFEEYFYQYEKKDFEPGDFLANITYVWDNVPSENKYITKLNINNFVNKYGLDYLSDILEIIE